MSGPRPEEILDALGHLPAWRRERALSEAPVGEIEALGEPWKRAILARALHQGTQDVADRLLRRGYPERDISDAVLGLALVAVSRGRLAGAHAGAHLGRDGSGYLGALAAVEVHSSDLEGAYAGLDARARSEAEMLLLQVKTLLRRDDRAGADQMATAAVGRLFGDGDLLRNVFWAVFEALASDSALFEGIILKEAASHALQASDARLAFLLSRELLQRGVQDPNIRAVLSDAVLALGRQFIFCADRLDPTALDEMAAALHLCAMSNGDASLAAHALQISAQMAFVMGRTAEGVERQRGFAHLSGRGHRADRIFTAPVLWTDEISDLPSAESFQFVGEPFRPLDPMARVEGLPLTNYNQPQRSWVAELRNAEILSGDTLGSIFYYVLTAEKNLILDGLNIHPSYHMGRTVESFRAYSPTDEVLLDLSNKLTPRKIRGRACLIGGALNYYHWLFEYLPRLGLLADAGLDVSSLSLLINAQPSDWQMESLEIAGVISSQVSTLEGGTSIDVDQLVLPSIPSTAYAVGYLRRTLNIDPASPGEQIVYISRIDVPSSRSRVANEMEVIDHMLSRGAVIVVASNETFSSQVEIFRSAKLVVAPHGAGLANIVFCPEGAAVIEINNRTNVNYTFFEEIARSAQLNFRRYVGVDEICSGPPEDAASVIDIAALSHLIDGALITGEC